MEALGKLKISNCINESSCFACCGQHIFLLVWDCPFYGCLMDSYTFQYLDDNRDVGIGNFIFLFCFIAIFIILFFENYQFLYLFFKKNFCWHAVSPTEAIQESL